MQQRLTRALSLTTEQQARLSEILQSTRQQMGRLRDQGASEEERRARAREIQAQTRSQIRNMLTDTQRQQYDELLKNAERQREAGAGQGRPGRVWIQNAAGQPEPLTLTLGIADDSFTEVLSGDLQAGQEVITGVLTTSKASGSSGFGPPGFGLRRF
jgi:HlyD family secretion protein